MYYYFFKLNNSKVLSVDIYVKLRWNQTVLRSRFWWAKKHQSCQTNCAARIFYWRFLLLINSSIARQDTRQSSFQLPVTTQPSAIKNKLISFYILLKFMIFKLWALRVIEWGNLTSGKTMSSKLLYGQRFAST